MTKPHLYTVAEVAESFGIHKSAIHRAISRGKFPGVRVKDTWMVPEDQLDAWSMGEWVPGPELPMERRTLTAQLRFAILTRDAYTCRYCGRKPPEVTLEVDHVVPFSKGGSSDPDNLVTACRECNRGKSDQ